MQEGINKFVAVQFSMYNGLINHITNIVPLSNEDIILVSSHFRPRRVKKKQFLFSQGDVATYESFIVKGCFKTFAINEKGEESILQFSIENWWIGDLYSFWTGEPGRYSIVAVEDSEILSIDNNSLERLFLRIPKMERYFRILLKNAYIAAQMRIYGNLGQTAEERYLEFIDRYPLIEQRIPQYMMASYLGITPEFLSKIRRRVVTRKR